MAKRSPQTHQKREREQAKKDKRERKQQKKAAAAAARTGNADPLVADEQAEDTGD